jgi:hypothetical protein|tara:strand:- start:571 stop:1275 length:705 start_codon:yes stop_codon:yes gene_type:complete
MIVGITGFIGSGKDTVAKMLVEKGAVQDSFAAPLKDLCASVFGWPRDMLQGDTVESRDFRETPDMYWTRKLGIDQFTPRLALQLLGTEIMRTHFNQDIWLDSLEYRIRKNEQQDTMVVVSDCRFKNELDLIKELNGIVVHVIRDELPEWYETAVHANKGSVPAKHTMETRFAKVHASEWKWVGYDFDFVIKNSGTLEDLQTEVDSMYSDMQNRKSKLKYALNKDNVVNIVDRDK